MEILKVSMKDYSSLHIGGEGSLVVVKTEDGLKEAVEHAKAEGLRVHVVGGGTNTYFAEDLSGYLFISPQFKGQALGVSRQALENSNTNNDERVTSNDVFITAYASENWDDLVKLSVEKNLWGIENLSRIPGSVGAAPVQNIGAYGVELKDTLVSVRVFDIQTGEFKDIEKTDCGFGYRDSMFKQNKDRYIIISITLKLSKERKPVLSYKPLDIFLGQEVSLSDIRDVVIKTREMKLPDWKEFPNTGSFFKNPIIEQSKVESLKVKCPGIVLFETDGGYKVSAAWLIEHVAVAKGVRVGNVGTWPNQPLVLVNYGEATAEEINNFANNIQNKIESETGLHLEREVNFVA